MTQGKVEVCLFRVFQVLLQMAARRTVLPGDGAENAVVIELEPGGEKVC